MFYDQDYRCMGWWCQAEHSPESNGVHCLGPPRISSQRVFFVLGRVLRKLIGVACGCILNGFGSHDAIFRPFSSCLKIGHRPVNQHRSVKKMKTHFLQIWEQHWLSISMGTPSIPWYPSPWWPQVWRCAGTFYRCLNYRLVVCYIAIGYQLFFNE